MTIEQKALRPQRAVLAAGLEISRIVTGLWQVADMERGGVTLDPVRGSGGDGRIRAGGLRHFRHGGSLRIGGSYYRHVVGFRGTSAGAGIHKMVSCARPDDCE
jgi:hypothetical protein